MSLEPFGAGLLCWPKTNTLDPVETTIERECSIGYSLWRGRVQGEELAADLLKLAVPVTPDRDLPGVAALVTEADLYIGALRHERRAREDGSW